MGVSSAFHVLSFVALLFNVVSTTFVEDDSQKASSYFACSVQWQDSLLISSSPELLLTSESQICSVVVDSLLPLQQAIQIVVNSSARMLRHHNVTTLSSTAAYLTPVAQQEIEGKMEALRKKNVSDVAESSDSAVVSSFMFGESWCVAGMTDDESVCRTVDFAFIVLAALFMTFLFF
jgi:hypothetical protein